MKKVMVVEDDPLNLELVTRFLKRSSFEVLVPHNAEQTVTMAQSQVPDVILMDLGLNEWEPPADGYELTAQLREIPLLDSVPIIALTAQTFPEQIEKAQQAGCEKHIEKPVRYKKLVALLEEVTAETE